MRCLGSTNLPSQVGPKYTIPEPVVNRFEPHRLLAEKVAHPDPALVPPNAAVAADEPDLEVRGVSDRF